MLIVGHVSTRNALYWSWFNKPPGICPCPLYTPPVALTDGLFCEYTGRELYSFLMIEFYKNVREQCGLKEREVVTRHQ